ncbi:MAG: hypothetical protein ACE5KZ_12820 [Candidatus Scalinduaceae bacterium]
MSVTYNTLIEEIKKLPFGEKEELKFLIEKYLVEERRDEIFENYKESVNEFKQGDLEFSKDVKKLKEIL